MLVRLNFYCFQSSKMGCESRVVLVVQEASRKGVFPPAKPTTKLQTGNIIIRQVANGPEERRVEVIGEM